MYFSEEAREERAPTEGVHAQAIEIPKSGTFVDERDSRFMPYAWRILARIVHSGALHGPVTQVCREA